MLFINNMKKNKFFKKMKSDIDEVFNCQNIFLNKNDIIFNFLT